MARCQKRNRILDSNPKILVYFTRMHGRTEALNKAGLGPQIKIITIIENQNKIKCDNNFPTNLLTSDSKFGRL
jgi:hypothetical protein